MGSSHFLPRVTFALQCTVGRLEFQNRERRAACGRCRPRRNFREGSSPACQPRSDRHVQRIPHGEPSAGRTPLAVLKLEAADGALQGERDSRKEM